MIAPLGSKWWTVMTRAWSIRWTFAAFLFTGLEIALPLMDGYETIPRGIFAAISGVSSAMAFLSRLQVQKGV